MLYENKNTPTYQKNSISFHLPIINYRRIEEKIMYSGEKSNYTPKTSDSFWTL
jgi:hypothetical protein